MNESGSYYIRELTLDEVKTYYNDIIRYAFYPSPSHYSPDEWLPRDEKNNVIFGAFWKNECIALAKIIPMHETIRGKTFSMGGVASVATNPEHRRKGVVKRLMLRLFQEMNEREIVVSTLYPFKESFYERFGYALFPQTVRLDIPILNMQGFAFHVDNYDFHRYRYMENYEEFSTFMKRFHGKIHGLGTFDYIREVRHDRYWVIEVRENNNVKAMALYKTDPKKGVLLVRDHFYEDTNAFHALFYYFSLHVDQLQKVSLELHPYEQDHLFPVDFRPFLITRDWVPSAMGRVIRVQDLNGLKLKFNETDVVLTLRVQDPYCPWNNHVFMFKNNNEELVIRELSNENSKIDAEISIRLLSDLVYNGYSTHLNWYKEWRDLPGTVKQGLRVLFPKEKPSLITLF